MLHKTNPLREITQQEFTELFAEYKEKKKSFALLQNCDWKETLAQRGFAPVFRNIDFSNFWLFQYNSTFHGIHFINCKGFGPFKYCIFYQCLFLNCSFASTSFVKSDFQESRFKNCHFNTCLLYKITCKQTTFHACRFEQSQLRKMVMDAENYTENDIDWTNNLIHTAWDTLHYQSQYETKSTSKPIIIIVYKPEDGVDNTDQLICYLQQNTHVILIHPSLGLSHPILKWSIDGLVLTGGPHLPINDSPYDERTTVELALLNKAKELNLPVLGVCRGHQLICWDLFKANITSVSNHCAEEHRIFVNPKSKLNTHLNRHYSDSQWQGSKVINKKFGLFSIKGAPCYHQQEAQLTGEEYENVVSMRTKDGTAEGIEWNNILTLQHHYEPLLSDNTAKGQLARTIIDRFIKKTEKHWAQTPIQTTEYRFQPNKL